MQDGSSLNRYNLVSLKGQSHEIFEFYVRFYKIKLVLSIGPPMAIKFFNILVLEMFYKLIFKTVSRERAY